MAQVPAVGRGQQDLGSNPVPDAFLLLVERLVREVCMHAALGSLLHRRQVDANPGGAGEDLQGVPPVKGPS